MRREGFLTNRDSLSPHSCHSCGKPIYRGLYCQSCINAFAKKRSELAHNHLADNLRTKGQGWRREADTSFLDKTYSKYESVDQPLLRSNRAKVKKKERKGAYFTISGE